MQLQNPKYLSNFRVLMCDWKRFALLYIKFLLLAIVSVIPGLLILGGSAFALNLTSIEHLTASLLGSGSFIAILLIGIPPLIIAAVPYFVVVLNKFATGGSLHYLKTACSPELKPLYKFVLKISVAMLLLLAVMVSLGFLSVGDLTPFIQGIQSENYTAENALKNPVILSLIGSTTLIVLGYMILNLFVGAYIYIKADEHFYGLDAHQGRSFGKVFASKIWRIIKSVIFSLLLSVGIQIVLTVVSFALMSLLFLIAPEHSPFALSVGILIQVVVALLTLFFSAATSAAGYAYVIKQPVKGVEHTLNQEDHQKM